ncbi:TlpA family protein disulfide reductase [Flavobacterium sp.]|jgi:cytochrome c biogenesis protein CcmG/thiol:disulfide interchange protein DsbE|uniref:TlpA family protein disulfide reductase n=1 Tax=Flavobacterium sp. TaxID=239 RepID=UPI0022CC1014|nr:TlpA disulfide reductase family protein [Flavobacterium sp.]MCZ8298504.1 TlpA disulfide reductase family protein [Flavobacterium sp.]
MKSKLTLLFFLIITFSSGQASNYYIDKLGRIIDQKRYKQEKSNSLEQVQKKMNSMQIVDEIYELYHQNDSVVYSYTWHFTENPQKTREGIERKKAIIGKIFPFEKETTLDGQLITIDDLKGKPTLINLWFTSCSPCIEEMPVLNELKLKYGEKFNFLSITMDSKSKVKKLLEKHEFTFTHIVNAKRITNTLGFYGYPVNVFLDKEGVVKIIEGNVPIYENENGELVMSDGIEFIQILEKLL